MRHSVLIFLCLTVTASAADPSTYPAAKAERNEERTVLVRRDDFADGQGVALKPGIEQDDFQTERAPDLVFQVQAPKEGRYRLFTNAGVDEYGAEKMRTAKGKYDSLLAQFVIDDGRPTQRVVFVPWHNLKATNNQRTGTFAFTGKPQTIKVWLQRGVQLNTLRLVPYTPPKVPPAAEAYRPEIIPPDTRPRLWVNADSLPLVRERLTKGENAPVWEKYRAFAKKPYKFEFEPDVERIYDAKLEQAATAKAFVYLMTGDAESGREAVSLIRDYLSVVSFGNWLDITREIGRAIYTASLVYDWCNDLLSEEDKAAIRQTAFRLAEDMEIGWPPFIGGVVNGHGNEMQMSRDLLSMAIAFYGDDSLPYRYCAYRALEELRPMLAYQYQSPRHHQGASYGPFRFECDMTAAWYFYRMTGKKVFHDNIEQVPLSWIYQRLPGGSVLPDGDGTYSPSYRRYACLLNFTYSGNPVLKGEYLRQHKPDADPLRWLLLNDPDLKPEPSLDALPRTLDFGPMLGGMIARTGWNMEPDATDIVVEMKGGGKHFANHQHSDAGSFQIYFHEYLVGDLGQYKFYGTPYDMNFCKRSVSHSMMLVYDPEENFGGTTARSSIGNDGGARLHRRGPQTPKQTEENPEFGNGEVRASAFGPDPVEPVFSFFSVDLADAYSDKVKAYTRTFCFLRDVADDVPGALLIYDRLHVPNTAHKEYWQLNSFKTPVATGTGLRIPAGKESTKGFVDLDMLVPAPANRTMEILVGTEAVHNVFGVQYQPPGKFSPGAARTLFSPKRQEEHGEFLTAIQMIDGADGNRVDVHATENDRMYFVSAGHYRVGLNRTDAPLDGRIVVDLPAGRDGRVLLTGLQAGPWTVRVSGETHEFSVTEKNSILYFEGRGRCTASYGK